MEECKSEEKDVQMFFDVHWAWRIKASSWDEKEFE